MASKPQCATLLVSDAVIREAETGKLSLIGCFGNFSAQKYPIQVFRFSAFTMISGIVEKRIVLKVSLVPHGKRTAIATCQALLERTKISKLPRYHIDSIDVVFPFRNVVIPKAGFYDLLLHWNGKLLAKRELSAILIPGPTPPK